MGKKRRKVGKPNPTAGETRRTEPEAPKAPMKDAFWMPLLIGLFPALFLGIFFLIAYYPGILNRVVMVFDWLRKAIR